MRTGFALAILMLSGLAATQVAAAPVAELKLVSEHPVDGMRGGNLSGLAGGSAQPRAVPSACLLPAQFQRDQTLQVRVCGMWLLVISHSSFRECQTLIPAGSSIKTNDKVVTCVIYVL